MLDLPLIFEEQETCLAYGATKRNPLVSAHYFCMLFQVYTDLLNMNAGYN